MLPSDVLGISIYSAMRAAVRVQRGPVFTNHPGSADEINRTTPKTQSALLEAMNEGRSRSDGEFLPLPQPFLVIATQNPVTSRGSIATPRSTGCRRFETRRGLPGLKSWRNWLDR